MSEGVLLNSTTALDVWGADWHIELNAADSGAVLTAVVLLFHEEEKLVHAPEAGAVLIVVVGEWFAKADGCDAALVIKVIAQNVLYSDLKKFNGGMNLSKL